MDKSNSTTDARIKATKRSYTDSLGKHMGIDETIIKSQSNRSFQVAKSDKNSFLHEIQLRVSPDGGNGDRYKRRWVTWSPSKVRNSRQRNRRKYYL